ARITYMSAISIVHMYVQRLPQDMYFKLAPVVTYDMEFEPLAATDVASGNAPVPALPAPSTSADGGVAADVSSSTPNKAPSRKTLFRCTFTLPSNAAIRRVSGPLMPNKKLAKQAAAYRTAKKLHQIGAIDDNLAPVIETADNDTDVKAETKSSAKAAKGVRASTGMYKIAAPRCLLAPTADGRPDTGGSSGAPGEHVPVPWHVYLFSLKHPLSTVASRIALLTASQLPDGVELPLYVEQFAKSSEAANTRPTVFKMGYLGSQILDKAQVDMLAQFSSHVMVRVLHCALVCDVAQIGCLLAPVLADSSGIDFGFAESCFADRTVAYKGARQGYEHLAGTLVMDGMDGGHLKLVERTCDDLDINSDVRKYHAERNGGGQDAAPAGAGDGARAEAQRKKSSGRHGDRARTTVRTMAEWSAIKRVAWLLPPREVGRGVPLLKVKYMSITLNYLVVAPTTAAGPDGQTPAAAPAPVAVKAGDAFPDGLYTSPFFCTSDPLTLSTLHNLSLLPSLFARLEQVLLAEEVRAQLQLPARCESVREALTASSANGDVSYERLETLGDAVLKYITTVMAFVSYPDAHEGHLTARRGRIICNAHLFDLAIKLELPPYVMSQPFVKRDVRLPGRGWRRLPLIPSRWICTSPFGAVGHSGNRAEKPGPGAGEKRERAPVVPIEVSDTRMLSEKTVADTIESLLGACVRDSGIDGALAAARSLGVVEDDKWSTWGSFADAWQASEAARKQKMSRLAALRGEMAAAVGEEVDGEAAAAALQEVALDQDDVIYGLGAHEVGAGVEDGEARSIEGVLGYTFRDRGLLTEALTHCSSSGLAARSYQRLEFLGDAVLDYFITERYYNFQPALTPHRITLVKHIAASNDLFAVILVCNGLHRHIRHSSPMIRDVVRDYESRLDHASQVW
ncbi:Dicer-like protein 1, partial [Coemansia spiralis]